MRTELLNQNVLEITVLALAEELPNILVAEGCECSYLELEEMVLGRVQIDCVNSTRIGETEGQDVVASRTDSENNIVGCRPQDAVVRDVVFPSESIDVRVIEAGVFCQCRVVVDAPVVVLIPRSGQRK